MQIGIVADKLDVSGGGSNFSLKLMAERLEQRGHNITIITLNFAHENNPPDTQTYKINPQSIESESQIGKARDATRRLADIAPQFDILHVFNPALLPSAGWFKRHEPGMPVVARLNTYDVFCTNLAKMDGQCHQNCTVKKKFKHSKRDTGSKIPRLPKYFFDTHVLSRLANNIDRLFAISPAVKEIYGGIGIDEEIIEVIPNFYDPDFTSTHGNTSFTAEHTLLYVGGLSDFKGVHLLIEAVSQLPDSVALSIVGDGDARQSLQRLADRLGVSNRVTFHGRVDHDELAPYYRGADLFVHPGLLPEPFGRTVLEAIQCRCPPVVSDIGGPPWVVGDCGLVFERNDSTDLADKINTLLTDTRQLRSLEQACRTRVERFSPDRTVSLVEKCYQTVIEDTQPTGAD